MEFARSFSIFSCEINNRHLIRTASLKIHESWNAEFINIQSHDIMPHCLLFSPPDLNYGGLSVHHARNLPSYFPFISFKNILTPRLCHRVLCCRQEKQTAPSERIQMNYLTDKLRNDEISIRTGPMHLLSTRERLSPYYPGGSFMSATPRYSLVPPSAHNFGAAYPLTFRLWQRRLAYQPTGTRKLLFLLYPRPSPQRPSRYTPQQ